jgi:hypothetical protein
MVDPWVFQLAGESLSVTPIEETQLKQPSAEIEFDRLTLATDSVAEGDPLVLQGTVRGKRIRYIYLDLMLQNTESGFLVGPVRREFFNAEKEIEVGGVKTPDWEEEVELSQSIELKMRILRDGKIAALAALHPQIYGLKLGKMHYAAAGQLLSKESKNGLDSMATFGPDGRFETVSSSFFGSQRGSGSTSVKKGDLFCPYLQAFSVLKNGIGYSSRALSNSLDAPAMFFEELPLQIGNYALGVSIQTWDGNWAQHFTSFQVF